MSSDPRDRNERVEAGDIAAFLGGYRKRLGEALEAVDAAALARAIEVLEEASADGARVYAIGNGGSAAIAGHLCCDLTKGTNTSDHRPIVTTSLAANMPLYSAIANDFAFSEVFSRQVDYFGRAGDVLIAISSSGNSENILRAVDRARSLGMTTIGLTGFDGGRLRVGADISLQISVSNYGVVEDAHQALMHVIAQFIIARRLGRGR